MQELCALVWLLVSVDVYVLYMSKEGRKFGCLKSQAVVVKRIHF